MIELDTAGIYAPAARLNLANMDAESGAVDRARREYDALLAEDLRDTTALLSRALLELRQGQANRATIGDSCTHRRRKREKAGKAASKDAIVAATIADNVSTNRFAAVILNLFIRLVSLLRGQETRPRAEEIGARSQAVRIAADGQLQIVAAKAL